MAATAVWYRISQSGQLIIRCETKWQMAPCYGRYPKSLNYNFWEEKKKKTWLLNCKSFYLVKSTRWLWHFCFISCKKHTKILSKILQWNKSVQNGKYIFWIEKKSCLYIPSIKIIDLKNIYIISSIMWILGPWINFWSQICTEWALGLI